jgi:calmodulin
VTGGGLIDKHQFERLLGRFGQVKDREEDMQRDLRAAFQVFDRDGNGFISRDELQAAMHMLGEPLSDSHLDQLMRETDLDHDGRIDFNEFCIKFRQLF